MKTNSKSSKRRNKRTSRQKQHQAGGRKLNLERLDQRLLMAANVFTPPYHVETPAPIVSPPSNPSGPLPTPPASGGGGFDTGKPDRPIDSEERDSGSSEDTVPELPSQDVLCSQRPDIAGADFSWRVHPRTGLDVNDNGIPDMPNTYQYANRVSQDVTLTGGSCGTHHWWIDGQKVTPLADQPEIVVTNLMPGLHTVKHEKISLNGENKETVTQQIEIKRDLLIVSIGDSVASGEGNPEAKQVLNDGLESMIKPVKRKAKWGDSPDGKACHRSSIAAPSQVAQRIEDADPYQSVTFVSVACSGATIHEGVIGPQFDEAIFEANMILSNTPNVKLIENAFKSQIDQVRDIICSPIEIPKVQVGSQPGAVTDVEFVSSCREIDALTISVGANDLQWADRLANLVISPGTWSTKHQDVEKLVADRLELLPGYFQELNDELEKLGVNSENVFITEYFDPTRGKQGEFCDNILDDIVEVDDGIFVGPALEFLGVDDLVFKVDSEEAQWAYEHALKPLNAIIRNAAEQHNWNYVAGIQEEFRNHGYCSGADRWVRTATESRLRQGPYTNNGGIVKTFAQAFPAPVNTMISFLGDYVTIMEKANTKGTLHPNEAGHQAIANLLHRDLQQKLNTTNDSATESDPVTDPTLDDIERPDGIVECDPAFCCFGPHALLDVNRDGAVTALDALHIINDLNEYGARPILNYFTVPDDPSESGNALFDVNRDRVVSARDVLSIINYLNRRPVAPLLFQLCGPLFLADSNPTAENIAKLINVPVALLDNPSEVKVSRRHANDLDVVLVDLSVKPLADLPVAFPRSTVDTSRQTLLVNDTALSQLLDEEDQSLESLLDLAPFNTKNEM